MSNSSMTRPERIANLNYDYGSKEKQFVENCHLCGNDNWMVLTHHDRYGYPAQTTSCTTCALTMLNPRMGNEGYAEFYEGVYRPLVSAYHGRLIDAQNIMAEQQDYSEEMERFFKPYLQGRESSTFLDIGGSTGVVAQHFTKCFGLKSTVLDPAPDEIAEADALGIETVTALFEEWPCAPKSYDIIGLFQTIDHLLDVKTAMAKIREIIKDDGLFLFDIVDFRAAYLKNWSVESATKVDHPYSFTEETTALLLKRVGFRPLRKAYSQDHHLVAYVCEPCAPQPDAKPDPREVAEFFREVRYVQNTAWKK
ncbi:MAG: class I SAM-dependent methyltransferase [Deltaproteobacteria bacterium]|jgi:SAM-dependent methyltransferase|nr:class I SAM-dependent methyltransferase [Deltaproteobacteria bacterium]MBT6432643.1 class I SAM-dependent methyltransferase [Deltaproteobacteria bacterium]